MACTVFTPCHICGLLRLCLTICTVSESMSIMYLPSPTDLMLESLASYNILATSNTVKFIMFIMSVGAKEFHLKDLSKMLLVKLFILLSHIYMFPIMISHQFCITYSTMLYLYVNLYYNVNWPFYPAMIGQIEKTVENSNHTITIMLLLVCYHMWTLWQCDPAR